MLFICVLCFFALVRRVLLCFALFRVALRSVALLFFTVFCFTLSVVFYGALLCFVLVNQWFCLVNQWICLVNQWFCLGNQWFLVSKSLVLLSKSMDLLPPGT